MKLMNKAKMLKETKRYSAVRKALAVFQEKLEEKEPKNFDDFRVIFPSADRVGNKKIEVCIDILGNSYRLIIENYYDSQRTYFVEFMTHKNYQRKYHS